MKYDKYFIGQRVMVNDLYYYAKFRKEKGTIVKIAPGESQKQDEKNLRIIFDNSILEAWRTSTGESEWIISSRFITPVDEPPVKIDKLVATAMFRAVSFGTINDDLDFIFRRLLPEAIYLKLGGKCSMCPCVNRCLDTRCVNCWKEALTMEGYPESLHWEYVEFEKEQQEGCI